METKYRSEYLKECRDTFDKHHEKQGDNFIEKAVFFLSHHMIRSDYENWLEDCLGRKNWQDLNNLIFQETRFRLLPGIASGYDHCSHLWSVLDSFACGDFTVIGRVLPQALGLTENGYPFLVVASNLLMALWYSDDVFMENAFPKAEKFIKMKKPQWERSIVSYLCALCRKKPGEAQEHLQTVCESYMRLGIDRSMKKLCVNAHGLYCLAQRLLPEEEFKQLKMPEYKNFSKEFAWWRLENPAPQLSLYFKYPAPMEVFNQICLAPVAISKIKQPYLNTENPYLTKQEKKKWFLCESEMLSDFIKNMAGSVS